NDGQFRTLCRSLGDEGLADDARFVTNGDRVTNRDALVGALEARLRSASAASWVDRLRRDGIPCGVVHDVAEAFAYARTVDLDALLSDEERQIRDLAREWVHDRILPEVEDWYERGEFPARELAKELGELGFFGMQLPGIGDLGAVAYGLVELELEAGDSGLR